MKALREMTVMLEETPCLSAVSIADRLNDIKKEADKIEKQNKFYKGRLRLKMPRKAQEKLQIYQDKETCRRE